MDCGGSADGDIVYSIVQCGKDDKVIICVVHQVSTDIFAFTRKIIHVCSFQLIFTKKRFIKFLP